MVVPVVGTERSRLSATDAGSQPPCLTGLSRNYPRETNQTPTTGPSIAAVRVSAKALLQSVVMEIKM